MIRECGGWKGTLTALALASVPQLLQTASDLLWGSTLFCDLKDIIRDKLVAHGEATECACGARVDGSVTLETWQRKMG
jgi:hypothetical protein